MAILLRHGIRIVWLIGRVNPYVAGNKPTEHEQTDNRRQTLATVAR